MYTWNTFHSLLIPEAWSMGSIHTHLPCTIMLLPCVSTSINIIIINFIANHAHTGHPLPLVVGIPDWNLLYHYTTSCKPTKGNQDQKSSRLYGKLHNYMYYPQSLHICSRVSWAAESILWLYFMFLHTALALRYTTDRKYQWQIVKEATRTHGSWSIPEQCQKQEKRWMCH